MDRSSAALKLWEEVVRQQSIATRGWAMRTWLTLFLLLVLLAAPLVIPDSAQTRLPASAPLGACALSASVRLAPYVLGWSSPFPTLSLRSRDATQPPAV